MEVKKYYEQRKAMAEKELKKAKKAYKLYMNNQPRFSSGYEPGAEVRRCEAEVQKWQNRINKVQ